jgi:hypothetical protein
MRPQGFMGVCLLLYFFFTLLHLCRLLFCSSLRGCCYTSTVLSFFAAYTLYESSRCYHFSIMTKMRNAAEKESQREEQLETDCCSYFLRRSIFSISCCWCIGIRSNSICHCCIPWRTRASSMVVVTGCNGIPPCHSHNLIVAA